MPGGKVEEGDANDIETALREAKEEIGLDPSLVSVVAVLESFTTKVMTNYSGIYHQFLKSRSVLVRHTFT